MKNLLLRLVQSADRILFLPLVLALLSLAAQPGFAAVVFLHDGATDPQSPSESWSITAGDDVFVPGPVNANSSEIEIGPLSPDPSCFGCGLNAWVVDDRSTASGSRFRYERTPSALQIEDAFANGWALRVLLRVSSAEDQPAGLTDAVDASVIAEYSEGTAGGQRRFGIAFGADPSGRATVSLLGDGRSVVTATTNAEYALYELIYDPVRQTASLIIDGVEQLSDYAGFDAGAVDARVNWGSGSSGSTGRGHYARVEWEVAPAFSGIDHAPLLLDFDVLTSLVDTSTGPAVARFSAAITDSAPGVCTASCEDDGSVSQIQLVHTGTGQRQSAAFVESLGGYTADVLLPAESAGGTWTVESLWLADQAGNRTVLSGTDLASAGYSVDFMNQSSAGDEVAPQLTGLTRAPAVVDASVVGTAFVTLNVLETGSGLCTVGCRVAGGPSQLRYRHFATGQIRNALIVSDGADYGASVDFLAGSAPGDWGIDSLRLVDEAGNRTILDGGDLAVLNYDHTLVVTTTSGDVAPPDVVDASSMPYPIDTTSGPVTSLFTAELADPTTGVCLDECGDWGGASQVMYRRGDSSQVRFAPLELVSGDLWSGGFEALVDLPVSRTANVWRPTNLLLVDEAGNRRLVPEPAGATGLFAGTVFLLLAAAAYRERRPSDGIRSSA